MNMAPFVDKGIVLQKIRKVNIPTQELAHRLLDVLYDEVAKIVYVVEETPAEERRLVFGCWKQDPEPEKREASKSLVFEALADGGLIAEPYLALNSSQLEAWVILGDADVAYAFLEKTWNDYVEEEMENV